MIMLRILGEIMRLVIFMIIGVCIALVWLGAMGGMVLRLAAWVQICRLSEATSLGWARSYQRAMQAIRREET